MKPITKFDGSYRFLSNFYVSITSIDLKTWKTIEHYYQSQKSKNPIIQEIVRNLETAYLAKQYGKTITLRDDWDDIKLKIMEKAVRAKFDQNYDLRERLLKTGDAQLIEGNYWGDVYWGVCKGVGENNLGKILMKIRNEYTKSLFERKPIQMELKFD